ncbi:MAG: zf-HC2 domain-containing protein [Deltaproteobacteria bacterium]|nr:zf-HC2 domain-containing protein [Deltaproteobacteria bacterium]
MAEDPSTTEPHEAIEARLSDYHEGGLPASERAEIEAHLAGCAACRAAYDELVETMAALSGMAKSRAAAPAEMPERVAETIHRRSAGRFFGRKTLGDRVPFGVLLIIAIVLLGVVAVMLRSSTTGSIRDRQPAPTVPANGGGRVAPTP